jgi:glycine/D-amino acid oxidase-like deaminating enzyme
MAHLWRTKSTTGGGIIGVSTAYYISRHPLYDPKIHNISLLEATTIASNSSGKGGGFIAEWATPECLAPLSFKLHKELAEEHEGKEIWGHRSVFAAEIKLYGQDVEGSNRQTPSVDATAPDALDWLRPGSILQYEEIGVPANSGQVNPYMLTRTLAKLAEEKGVTINLGASVTEINVDDEKNVVISVSYAKNETTKTIDATDILVAAGPWTPKILPAVSLLTPRGHSVIVKPARPISPYILFPDIQPAPGSSIESLLSPDIYPRPADHLHAFDTVYASGPDDYECELPSNSDEVELVEKKLEDVLLAIGSVSEEIYSGKSVKKQACYKSQIRKHKEDEAVGPIVGAVGVKGLWLATGHDEWGIQNGPATGLVMSEMILEGKARSADCESLDPKHFLQRSP